MGVHRFGRALDDMESKLIDKQGRTSITNDVKISKFLNNILDIIKQFITPDLTDDMTYNDIITKSEQCEAANAGANTENTKLGYPSEVSRYTNAASTRADYTTQ